MEIYSSQKAKCVSIHLARSSFSETKQSIPTDWSNFSTFSWCLLSDSLRYVSECLEKITSVWRQGAAQQLRYR
jgi:hypothetical protein